MGNYESVVYLPQFVIRKNEFNAARHSGLLGNRLK